MSRLRQTLPLGLAALCGGALATAPAAPAATRLVVKGAGFGHGVGMSQYGAYGYALKGVGYEDILAHYYTGTKLATLTTSPEVTVLLRSSKSAAFTGASRIAGRELDPGKTYSVIEARGTVVLRSSAGRKLAAWAGAVRVSGGDAPVKLLGKGPNAVRDGLFRGALEFRPSGGGALLVINALGLDSYLRGVVPSESPSSWPQAALRAQAVAARTYALTTNAGGSQGFTQWPDTRSQVYNGVSAERPTTDTAVAATSRQVVTYLGKPITAYFFSTSGGETENVENGFPGAAPQPYLKGVEDPYDDVSPRHRWRASFSLGQAQSRLGSLVKGSFRAIKVTKRGVSPRIVSASVIGSRGTTTVSGPTLRARFGLFDSWATFTTIGAKVTAPEAEAEARRAPGGGRRHHGRRVTLGLRALPARRRVQCRGPVARRGLRRRPQRARRGRA